MTAIPIYIDLKSPYSYVAAHRALALSRAGKAEFDWRPFTLDIAGRAGGPGWLHRIKYVYRDARRFATPLGLTIRGPEKVYDSTVAQIGLLYAKQAGVHEAYIETVYAMFFNRELAPDDASAVQVQFAACGCDADGFPAFLEGEGPKLLESIRVEADEAGVFGVPSLIADGELFWGQDRLDLALERAGVSI